MIIWTVVQIIALRLNWATNKKADIKPFGLQRTSQTGCD